jgi:hypothetical protein
VGIRSPKVPFQWPKVLPLVKLEHFLDTKIANVEHPLNRRQQTLMRKLAVKHNNKLDKHWYCFDAGASWRYVQCLKDKSPCLTRSRPSGHYVPRLRRFLSLVEHGSLQGLPRTATLHMAEAAAGDERVVRAALGDAMSLNVLMRVLGKALYSAGLVSEAPLDPWRQLAKDVSRCILPSCGSRVLTHTWSKTAGSSGEPVMDRWTRVSAMCSVITQSWELSGLTQSWEQFGPGQTLIALAGSEQRQLACLVLKESSLSGSEGRQSPLSGSEGK